MEKYENRFTNTVLVWTFGLVLGVLFGLIILGWWLFPVQWVDASPSMLLYDYQVETLRTTIEAYGYNNDAASAKARYDSLGENKETALAQIAQNPGNLPDTLIASFSQNVAGVPMEQLATQPIQTPKTTSGLNPWVAIIVLVIFLVIGGLLTYIILRGRERGQAPATPEEPVPVAEIPTEETSFEETPVEEAPVTMEAEAAPAPVSGDETWMQEVEAEAAQEEAEAVPTDRLDLPPFLATAGVAAAAYELGKDETPEEELPVGAAIGEEMPEEVVLPEAELEEFPFEEQTAEETVKPPATDMSLGGAAFGATALAASELFGEEGAAEPTETANIGLPEEEAVEEPVFEEEDQVVNAYDPVEIKMRKRLDYVEGIGPVYAGKLSEIGIETTGKLLVDGVSRKGRKEIAENSGISEKLILEWINHVDLYRIKGVGSEYADLLEAAGVDTIPELAQRRADNLHQAMVSVNEEKKLVRQLPTEEHVADWIEQAKELPRIIQY